MSDTGGNMSDTGGNMSDEAATMPEILESNTGVEPSNHMRLTHRPGIWCSAR